MSMHKAAQPSGGMGSSNPRRWRGERLHYHGDGVWWVICAFCVIFDSWLVSRTRPTYVLELSQSGSPRLAPYWLHWKPLDTAIGQHSHHIAPAAAMVINCGSKHQAVALRNCCSKASVQQAQSGPTTQLVACCCCLLVICTITAGYLPSRGSIEGSPFPSAWSFQLMVEAHWIADPGSGEGVSNQ